MFVDDLPNMPKVYGYKVVDGVPKSKCLKIGMFKKKWDYTTVLEFQELDNFLSYLEVVCDKLSLDKLSSKSKDIADEFEKRIIERDSHEEALGDDVSRHESDSIIFLDVVGGVNKKGRIYGLGPEAGKYKPFRSSRSDGILHSEFEQMRAENTSLKEKLKAHEKLICASREQMTKLMEMISQGHLHPPLPPST